MSGLLVWFGAVGVVALVFVMAWAVTWLVGHGVIGLLVAGSLAYGVGVLVNVPVAAEFGVVAGFVAVVAIHEFAADGEVEFVQSASTSDGGSEPENQETRA